MLPDEKHGHPQEDEQSPRNNRSMRPAKWLHYFYQLDQLVDLEVTDSLHPNNQSSRLHE
jgi:hypothetical protein